MSIRHYLAKVIFENGVYKASLPDFPDLKKSDQAIGKVLTSVEISLNILVDEMVEKNIALPEPLTLNDVEPDELEENTNYALIPIEASNKKIRVLISMPEDLLDDIAKVTSNRSKFLSMAAREKLRLSV